MAYNPPAYVPAAHTSPETAKVGSVSVQGLAPGRLHIEVNDQWAAAYVFVPTATTSDGYPGSMVAVASGGTVT